MCKNLVEKGNLDKPLLLYNRTKQRSTDLSASLPPNKTEVVDDLLAGVAKADIIFTCLTNDAAVQDIYDTFTNGNGGSLKGKLFVECSTIHPDKTTSIGKQINDCDGAQFIASPVFGAPAMADAGQLIFVVAGPKAAIERIEPCMKGVMGKAVISFEDEPYSKPLQLKLIGNSLVLNMVTGLAEGYTMAEKTGVGIEPLKQFVDSLFGGVYSAYSERMIQGTYWKREEPLFSAAGVRKDAGHIMTVAEGAGMEHKGVKVTDEYAKVVVEHQGGEKGDIAGIYGGVRKMNGLKFENDA